MQEMGITRNIVAIVAEHAQGARVKRVSIEVGKLSAVVPNAIRHCFDVCSRDTLLEGAELTIREIAGKVRCRVCGQEREIEGDFGRCMCGSRQIQCIAGEELNITEMELA